MAMMVSRVARVNSSHPYVENDPAPSFAPTVCAFHLGFGLVIDHRRPESLSGEMCRDSKTTMRRTTNATHRKEIRRRHLRNG